MSTTTIERTSPFRFEAMQRTTENLEELKAWINAYPAGDATWTNAEDESGDICVQVGAGPFGDAILVSVHVGDWVFKQFSKWWTVVADADFGDDYATVAP